MQISHCGIYKGVLFYSIITFEGLVWGDTWPGFVFGQLLGHRGHELGPQCRVHGARLEAVETEPGHGPLGRLPGRAQPLVQDVSSFHHPENLHAVQLLLAKTNSWSKVWEEKTLELWKKSIKYRPRDDNSYFGCMKCLIENVRENYSLLTKGVGFYCCQFEYPFGWLSAECVTSGGRCNGALTERGKGTLIRHLAVNSDNVKMCLQTAVNSPPALCLTSLKKIKKKQSAARQRLTRRAERRAEFFPMGDKVGRKNCIV